MRKYITTILVVALLCLLYLLLASSLTKPIFRNDPSTSAESYKPIKIEPKKEAQQITPVQPELTQTYTKPSKSKTTKSKPKTYTCPKGTMNINTPEQPACKIIPTGCPYGDSIPMDQCHE